MGITIPIDNDEIQALLCRFENLGGVLNFFVFRCDSKKNEIERHRLVACASLRFAIAKRYDWECQRWTKVNQERQTTIDKLAARIERKAKQKGISVDASIAADMATTKHQTPKMALVEENILKSCIPVRLSLDLFLHGSNDLGYIYAFSDPPDGIRHIRDKKICNEIFELLNNTLFGEMALLSIYRWPTNCSDYFMQEDEYCWGNLFWTVYSPHRNWYIGILAAEMID